MNAGEAAKAAEIIKPKIAIPMHYNANCWGRKNGEEFKRNIKERLRFYEQAKQRSKTGYL